MNLYRKMDRTEVQFDFLTFGRGSYDNEIRGMGGKVHRIPHLRNVGVKRYKHHLDHFFKKHDYDMIHVHMDKLSGWVLEIAKDHNVRVRIAHSHYTAGESGWLSKMYYWHAGRKIRHAATHSFASSIEAGERLFGKETFFIQVNSGIDTEKHRFRRSSQKAVRAKLGLHMKDFVIGHIGSFNEPGDQKWLIDMFSEVLDHIPEARLVLIGDGRLRRTTEKRVREEHLEPYVIPIDEGPDSDDMFSCLDVLVLPSSRDGLPLSALEAQSTGLLCFVSDRISGDIDFENGLTVFLPMKDRQAWIEQFIQHRRSGVHRRSEYRSLLERGYDIQETSAELERFYQSRMKEASYGFSNRVHTNS